MARPNKPFKITTMKVPVEFRKRVVEEARKENKDPTDYMLGKKLVPA